MTRGQVLSKHTTCRARNTSPQDVEATPEETVGVRTDASVSSMASVHHSTEGFKILGLDATPELFAIILVYFVQGILGISRLAVSFYFKDELGLDPAELAIFSGLSALPWLVKPVYGFLSDTVPIFGYRRRSYLALCGVIGCAAWSTLALSHPSPAFTTLLLLVASAGTACSDVVVDSIVVGASRNASASVAGSYQSLSWGVSAIGGIMSAYFSGSLIEDYGVPFVFGLTAVFPLMTMGAALLIQEKRVSKNDVPERAAVNGTATEVRGALQSVKIKEQFQTLRAAISQPAILYPAIFCFVWQATPSADTALFYFYNDSLGFGPEFLGKIRLVGSISALVGVWAFNTFLKKVQLRTIFKWTAITGTALSLTQLMLVLGINRELGISDQWFCLSDEILLTVLGRLSFMPVLVLAARICPEGVEATLFATLMSVCNGGAVTGSFIGSVLTKVLGVNSANFDQLPLLVSICALGTLLPLPLLNLVPILEDEEEEEQDPDKVL